MSAVTHRKIGARTRGKDVERFQHFTNVRLDRRNQDRYMCPVDGENGPKTARAVHRAAYCLGIDGQRLANTKKGVYSQSLQRVIINPDLRTEDELKRARRRMNSIREKQDKREARNNPSGLSNTDRATARSIVVRAARLGHAHAAAVHYTMGSSRWQGIARRDLVTRGDFPNYADCSSYATWCLWNALHVKFGLADKVNGAGWRAGYTGTLLTHGILVDSGPTLDLRKLLPGDLILYGSGHPGKHVAIYVGNGMVVSHGSEGGPYLIPYNYRRDIMCARRYI